MSVTHGTPTTDFAFGSSTTVAKPSVSVGDWLIWEIDNGVGNNGTAGINTPAGFAAVGTAINIASGSNRTTCHAVFKRKIDGTESTTFTATGTASAGSPGMASIMTPFTGGDQTDIIDAVRQDSGNATGTTVTSAGLTVTGSGGMLIACHADWEHDVGPLTGMSQVINSSDNGLTLDAVASTPGATGALTCSCTATEQWTVFLISLKAAASSAASNRGRSSTQLLLDGFLPHLRMSPRSEQAARERVRAQKRAYGFAATA